MSASNYNWVCFSCRTSRRQAKHVKQIPNCLTCGTPCFWLGYKVEIPKKSDQRGWRKLELECYRRHQAEADRKQIRRARVARQISRIRVRGANKDREKLIGELKKKSGL